MEKREGKTEKGTVLRLESIKGGVKEAEQDGGKKKKKLLENF